MKKTLLICAASLALINFAFAAKNLTPTYGNLSGTFICSGHDEHDGDYTGSEAHLMLNKAQSSGEYQTYDMYSGNEGPSAIGVYKAAAVRKGNTVASYFVNTATDKKSLTDHGVVLMTISQKHKKIILTAFYYEPEYVGGGNGHEVCISK